MISIINASNKDWSKFIKENNITTKDVDFYLNNILDTPEFDKAVGKIVDIENDMYTKQESSIHGFGIFAKKDISKNETLGIALGFSNSEKYRSYIGRFTNHSNIKNAIFKELDSGDVVAICTKDIKGGEEILVDYRDHFLKW